MQNSTYECYFYIIIEDWNSGFFATFRLCLKSGVKSRYIRENLLEHIKVHSLVFGYLLDPDVRILRQCLTIEIHGVCISILVQYDFQSVG